MRATLPSGTEVEVAHPVGEPVMGLVVAPDLYGLRPLFEELAARLATEWQMTVAVVEPFPGHHLGPTMEERLAVLGTLDDDAHLRDLIYAADITGCERVGALGFCMGGMYVLKAARSDRFARLVSFYGMVHPLVPGPGQGEPLDYLASGHPARVLAIVGERDPYTPPDDVAALEAAGATVVRYPEADHGFAHDAARPAHRADDAADAFKRAREWLLG